MCEKQVSELQELNYYRAKRSDADDHPRKTTVRIGVGGRSVEGLSTRIVAGAPLKPPTPGCCIFHRIINSNRGGGSAMHLLLRRWKILPSAILSPEIPATPVFRLLMFLFPLKKTLLIAAVARSVGGTRNSTGGWRNGVDGKKQIWA